MFKQDEIKFQKIKDIGLKEQKILAVLVFGSYIRKEYYRDIDICIIFYPEIDEGIKFKEMIKFSSNLSTFFDISFFTDLPLYVRSRVIKEGKILFNKDYELLFEIYMKTIKDYSLFKPHFDIFLEAVKNG